MTPKLKSIGWIAACAAALALVTLRPEFSKRLDLVLLGIGVVLVAGLSISAWLEWRKR